jgi:hypothetical protein
MSKTKRLSYSVAEKLKVLQYAEQNGFRAAERHFDIDHSMISRWHKNKEKFEAAKKKSRRIGENLGRNAQYPEAEADLNAWILEYRQDGIAVTTKVAKTYMKELLKKKFTDIYPGADEKFLASDRWFYGFLKRHDLSLRRKTKIGQKLPAHLDDKLLEFQRFIIRKRKQFEYNFFEIGNMDETPVYFDMVGNLTIDKLGAKTVQIRTTGNENNRFTCVLTVLADGTKLLPMVIFKGKLMPKDLPSKIIVSMHPKGWMDETGMKIWFNKIWEKRPGRNQTAKPKSLLVLDSFESHKTDFIKNIAKYENTNLAIIPGGLTSIVQPLDVSINKPFKDRLREKWNIWMSSGEFTYTKGGNIKKPAHNIVCKWILEAWNEIPKEMIVKSFKKCGISNAMDGSEDDLFGQEFENIKEDNNNEYEILDKNNESADELDKLEDNSEDEK